MAAIQGIFFSHIIFFFGQAFIVMVNGKANSLLFTNLGAIIVLFQSSPVPEKICLQLIDV